MRFARSWTLATLVAMLLLSAAGEESKFQTLMEMLSGITSRPTWRHKFTLPLDVLLQARTVAGDERRMEAFMRKVVTGQPVKWAMMGSSISTGDRQPGYCDVTWHGLLHRWLELTFTPCGTQLSIRSVRTRQLNYTEHHRQSCKESTIQFVDLSRGASGCIMNEKCMMKPDKLPVDVDMVFIEYTHTAAHRGTQRLDTPERRALERMIRYLLMMPRQPAIVMFHVWSPRTDEGGKLGPKHFGPGTEDFHNLVAMHYGKVQVISARAVLYDLLSRHGFNDTKLSLFEPDGLHPMGPGQHVYGDVFIAIFQMYARRAMAEIMMAFLNPGVPALMMPLDQPSVSYAHDMHEDLVIAWPQAITDYSRDVGRIPVPKLPGFLIEGNHEHYDGQCIIGQELEKYVVSANGFQLLEEQRAKWGYVGATPGASLVLEFDTTFGGRIKPAGNRTVLFNYTDGLGKTHPVVAGTAEVLLSYLKTYENVGNAQVQCVGGSGDAGGCSCNPVVLEGMWEHRRSVPFAQRIRVTPSTRCRIQITILDETSTKSFKFKVVSVFLSELPFHFEAQHIDVE